MKNRNRNRNRITARVKHRLATGTHRLVVMTEHGPVTRRMGTDIEMYAMKASLAFREGYLAIEAARKNAFRKLMGKDEIEHVRYEFDVLPVAEPASLTREQMLKMLSKEGA